jgi:hypothetical protein
MHFVSRMIGVAYPPAMLFILLIFGLVMVIMQLSIIITKLSIAVKRLNQEMGLLKLDVLRSRQQKLSTSSDIEHPNTEL